MEELGRGELGVHVGWRCGVNATDDDCAGQEGYATGLALRSVRNGSRATGQEAHRTGTLRVSVWHDEQFGDERLGCHVDFRMRIGFRLAIFASIREVAGMIVPDLAADDAQHFRL